MSEAANTRAFRTVPKARLGEAARLTATTAAPDGSGKENPHVDAPLEQYLSDLLTTLVNDSKAPQLARIHPLDVLFDVSTDLVLQGTATRRGRCCASARRSTPRP